MTRKIRILGIQINSVIGDKAANFEKVEKLLEYNHSFKPDLVVLPEVFNVGLNHELFTELAEPVPNGKTSLFLSELAKKYHTNIVGGSIIEKCTNEKLRNTSVVFDRNGKIIAKYQKIHMFSYYGSSESKYITNGDKTVIAQTDFGKIGLSVCYDLRFPELYRTLAYSGAEIIVCPAAWPYPRLDHWITLCKARAVENLCYFVAVNQTGKVTLSRTNLGQSMIINPWGEVLASAGSNEGVVMTEIDLDEVKRIREEFPVLSDRNLDAYRI